MQHTTYPILVQPQAATEKISPDTLKMLFRISALVIANVLVCAFMMAALLIVIS